MIQENDPDDPYSDISIKKRSLVMRKQALDAKKGAKRLKTLKKKKKGGMFEEEVEKEGKYTIPAFFLF